MFDLGTQMVRVGAAQLLGYEGVKKAVAILWSSLGALESPWWQQWAVEKVLKKLKFFDQKSLTRALKGLRWAQPHS